MIRLISLIVLITGMLTSGLAQGVATTYRLQPEDVISMRVYGEPEMNVDAPISLDGYVSIPFLGFIKFAGRTVEEIQTYIANELKTRKYYTDPKVTINIVQIRPVRASAVGFFTRAGQFAFRPGERILALISAAGNPQDGRANLRRATLIRKGTVEQIPIDLEAMLERGDLSQNYELQDGDILSVPEDASNRIMILGYVPRPQRLLWRKGITLADVIAEAGGEIPYQSRFSQIQIVRETPGRPGERTMFKVNFARFISKNDYSQNPELQKGDLVIVPSTKTPDTGRLNSIANVVYTISIIFGRNGLFFPRF
ncbi:MAG: polysaccharide biosynthesis/export family protein [Fimbriimonadales bacterium]